MKREEVIIGTFVKYYPTGKEGHAITTRIVSPPLLEPEGTCLIEGKRQPVPIKELELIAN